MENTTIHPVDSLGWIVLWFQKQPEQRALRTKPGVLAHPADFGKASRASFPGPSPTNNTGKCLTRGLRGHVRVSGLCRRGEWQVVYSRVPSSRLKSTIPSITPDVRAAQMSKEPKVPSHTSSLVSRVNGWKRDAARRLRSLFTVSHDEARDSAQGSHAEGYGQLLENFRRATSTCQEVTGSKWHQTGPLTLSSESRCSTTSTVFG